MIKLIDGATGTTTSSGTDVYAVAGSHPRNGLKFQVTIQTTATVQIYVSNDNTNWTSVDTSTASGVYEQALTWPFVKADVTAHTGGTVDVTLTV